VTIRTGFVVMSITVTTLSGRELNQDLARAKKAAGGGNAVQLSLNGITARGVALLFEVMALLPPGWETGPRHGALPTVALLPGIGGRLIYGGTADDLWTMEGPDGAQQCRDLPQQGSYSALVSASDAMVWVALPQRASQPSALVSFKSALKMGWYGFKLLRRVFSERTRHWAARLI
jgi:hypothetical protein